jgi:hypothetical protein
VHDGYVVIFDDLKRFARDTIFHLKLRQELDAYHASVECLNFKFEDTPEGQFVKTVIAAQGQLDRAESPPDLTEDESPYRARLLSLCVSGRLPL